MPSKRTEKITNGMALIVVGIVVTFTIIRQFFGAELSDEAYSVAETYMVSEGALPFVNNWSQMPGWPLLLAPFMKIYTLIMGTEGIVLFFRMLCVCINAITCFVMSIILKEHIHNRFVLALLSITYFGASGLEALGGFRGDKLAIDLTAIGVMLLVTYFADNKGNVRLFISGILLSLSVLSYPTYLILFAFYLIAILVLCHRRAQGYKAFVFFLVGASITTLVVVTYLAINSGFKEIIDGIRYLLKDVTYFQLKNEGIAKLPKYFGEMWIITSGIVKCIVIAFCVFLFLCLAGLMWKHSSKMVKDKSGYIGKRGLDYHSVVEHIHRIKSIYGRQLLLVSIITGICLYHGKIVVSFWTADHIEITLQALTAETIGALLIWPFAKKDDKLCRYCMGLIWFPSYAWVFITGIGTYSSMMGRHQLLKNAAFLFGIMAFFTIRDNLLIHTVDMHASLEKKAVIYDLKVLVSNIITIFIMGVVSFTYLFNAYSYVYRDEAIRNLNTVVSSGPYKGIHTTSVRSQGLIELGREINKYVGEGDYLLALDNDPFIYLMTNAIPCTPSSWDQALYSYNFDSPDLYYDYFSVTGKNPTKIVYFYYGRDEKLSIDVNYKFNNYVVNNFDMICEDRNFYEWNYCGKEVTCELLIFDRKQ